MTLSVKHATLSGVQDSGDGKLSSNAWNEGHAITGSANTIIGIDSLGAGQSVSVTGGLVLSGSTLTISGAISPSSISTAGTIVSSTTGSSFGIQTGTASSAFYLDGANASAVLQGRFWTGGNPFNVGKIDFNGTANSPAYDTQNASNSHLFKLNGTNAFAVGPNGIGYVAGVGGAVTQATSRTTGVTLNKVCGAITLVSAAGTASWQSFTVTNSTVAATDTVRVVQKSGTDKNMIHVTAVGAGSFEITFATTGGTTTEQPVFNFAVIKAATS